MIRLLVMGSLCCLILAGCFYDSLLQIDRVQLGPDKWPDATTQPASQPEGTAEGRLEKMMELYR